MKNELTTHFEQNFTIGSYRVGIWCAWCCRKACEICSSIVQKKNLKSKYFSSHRLPKEQMTNCWSQGILRINKGKKAPKSYDVGIRQIYFWVSKGLPTPFTLQHLLHMSIFESPTKIEENCIFRSFWTKFIADSYKISTPKCDTCFSLGTWEGVVQIFYWQGH
jgi:hypothetical protein